MASLNTKKYNYFFKSGSQEPNDHIPQYSCGLLTDSAILDRFEHSGSYKTRIKGYNGYYTLKITYAEGDFDGLGLMVKSVGVLAHCNDILIKDTGLFFETTPYYIEGPDANSINIRRLTRNNGGKLPDHIHVCLRIISGIHNMLENYGIPFRGSTSPGKFREAFGEGNTKFLTMLAAMAAVRPPTIEEVVSWSPAAPARDATDNVINDIGEPTVGIQTEVGIAEIQSGMSLVTSDGVTVGEPDKDLTVEHRVSAMFQEAIGNGFLKELNVLLFKPPPAPGEAELPKFYELRMHINLYEGDDYNQVQFVLGLLSLLSKLAVVHTRYKHNFVQHYTSVNICFPIWEKQTVRNVMIAAHCDLTGDPLVDNAWPKLGPDGAGIIHSMNT